MKYNTIIKGEILQFENHEVYKYLNEEFINEEFFIWNIKFKLGKISSNKNQAWENEVEKILADS